MIHSYPFNVTTHSCLLLSVSCLHTCHLPTVSPHLSCLFSAPDPAWGAQLHPAPVSAEAAFPRRPWGLPLPLRAHQQPATQDPPGRSPEGEREAEGWQGRRGGDGEEAEETEGGAPRVSEVQAAAVLILPDLVHLRPGQLPHTASGSWSFSATLSFGW